MKKYLFRGMTSGGKWVYGSLIVEGDFCCILERSADVHPVNYPYLNSEFGIIDGQVTPVIPKTVGRCICNPKYDSDCTGQKLFEGDIIHVYHRKADMNNDLPDTVAIVIDEHSITENGLGRWFPQDTTRIKLVGNVYNHPEMVGREYAKRYIDIFGFDIFENQ